MKLFSKAFWILFISSILTVAAGAQKVETEGELFIKISQLAQTKKDDDQQQAYALGKTFMSKFGKNDDDETKKVRDFMETYETSFVAKKIEGGKTADAFAFGKEALAQTPDNTHLAMTLAYSGFLAYVNKKDKTYGADSILFANKALQLLAENKLPKSFEPFADLNEATASMYYVIGNFSVDSKLNEAAANFYKAVGFNSKLKNNSYPYFIIAYNYEKEFAKAAKEFDDKYGSDPSSSAAQTAETHLEKLMNNMQDAYARAIKLGEAENSPKLGEWKKRFMQIYGFIKGDDKIKADDQGAAQYLANVLTTPMPDPSAP